MLLFFSSCGRGPEKAASFKAIFDHYRSDEDVVAVSLPPGLLGLLLPGEDPEMAELKELMGELSSFRMLSVEANSSSSEITGELRSAVNDFTYREEFSDLFRLQNGQDDIHIRIL